jgi:hypothetical protein
MLLQGGAGHPVGSGPVPCAVALASPSRALAHRPVATARVPPGTSVPQPLRHAFRTASGALIDPGLPESEQQRAANLFRGAVGALKNPHSHRSIQFNDLTEAAEIVVFASFLLRISTGVGALNPLAQLMRPAPRTFTAAAVARDRLTAYRRRGSTAGTPTLARASSSPPTRARAGSARVSRHSGHTCGGHLAPGRGATATGAPRSSAQPGAARTRRRSARRRSHRRARQARRGTRARRAWAPASRGCARRADLRATARSRAVALDHRVGCQAARGHTQRRGADGLPEARVVVGAASRLSDEVASNDGANSISTSVMTERR